MPDPRLQGPLHLKIDQHYIQEFCKRLTIRFRIVTRLHIWKQILSPEKESQIEVVVAAHLRMLCILIICGAVEEDDLSNADETHFVINVGKGTKLGFLGCAEGEYADVASGRESFIVMVRFSCVREAGIEPRFLVLTKKSRSYPIRGTPHEVASLVYRTGRNFGWTQSFFRSDYLRST